MNFRKIGLFLLLAYAGSWSVLGIFTMLGGRLMTPAGAGVATLYMFMPMVSALLVQKVIYGERVRGPLGVSFRPNRWWLVAWLLPVVLIVPVVGVSAMMPGVSFEPGIEGLVDRYGERVSLEELEVMLMMVERLPVHPIWVGLAAGMIAGVTINAVAGFGEELGWRGLLQHELEPIGFWSMSFGIGLVWGLWHAPLILLGHNYPLNPVPGVFMMTAFAVLFSPIFSYLRTRAGSVLAPAILHGTFNGTAGLSLLVLAGGTDLTIGPAGAAGLIVLAVVNVVLLLVLRADAGSRRWESQPSGAR